MGKEKVGEKKRTGTAKKESMRLKKRRKTGNEEEWDKETRDIKSNEKQGMEVKRRNEEMILRT